MKVRLLAGLVLAQLMFSITVAAQQLSQAAFDERREKFIDNAIQNFNENATVLQAYRGLPVSQAGLDRLLSQTVGDANADFRMVVLMRILYFSNGQYDNQILSQLSQLPMWLSANEDNYVYWSENHIVMWQGSALLLQEKYGWYPGDTSIRVRVKHWLELKLKYNFYEFFSSVYAPFTIAGVLNLADFSQDPEIRELAKKVAILGLKELLMNTTDRGVFFPAAGRNTYSQYRAAYTSNYNRLLWMLTGFGEEMVSASHASVFLATTSLNVQEALDDWSPELSTTIEIGHPLTNRIAIHAPLTYIDRIIFQWSMGAYFHPDVARETINLFYGYNLWGHSQFEDFAMFQGVPPQLAQPAAAAASAISKSSVLNTNVKIFKNRQVSLSSAQDYWKGHLGYQQWPWAATAGTGAVFTRCGALSDSWEKFSDLNANASLPYIEQKDNVALIMYRPLKALLLLGYPEHNVLLHWPEETYDEVRNIASWVVGREGDGYIAVRRYCFDDFEGIPACTNQDGQVWAVVVGNKEMHGSFDNFANIIAESKYDESWTFEFSTLGWTYCGMIEVDGKKIEHCWEGDLFNLPANPTTGVREMRDLSTIASLFPNPARDQFFVQLKEDIPVQNIIATDITGKQMQVNFSAASFGVMQINTSAWAKGTYMLTLVTDNGFYTGKVIVQ